MDVRCAVECVLLRNRGNLGRGIERIPTPTVNSRFTFDATISDISANGAFIICRPPPLLSRLMLRFELASYGPIAGIAWCLWRRVEDDRLPDPRPKGVGVLFEHLPLAARVAIQSQATSRAATR